MDCWTLTKNIGIEGYYKIEEIILQLDTIHVDGKLRWIGERRGSRVSAGTKSIEESSCIQEWRISAMRWRRVLTAFLQLPQRAMFVSEGKRSISIRFWLDKAPFLKHDWIICASWSWSLLRLQDDHHSAFVSDPFAIFLKEGNLRKYVVFKECIDWAKIEHAEKKMCSVWKRYTRVQV